MASRSTLLKAILIAFASSAAILVLVILPAEYHVDPTGFGELTGLMALSAPPPVDVPADSRLGAAPPDAGQAFRSYQLRFRTDEVPIRLDAVGQLEYKVRMQAGGTLVYSWAVDDGVEVYYDFHGEPSDDPNNATSYETGLSTHENGSLIAPFTGIHGWYLQNGENKPITVRLKMSGFYELRELAAATR